LVHRAGFVPIFAEITGRAGLGSNLKFNLKFYLLLAPRP
jgi:hypothetical protein